MYLITGVNTSQNRSGAEGELAYLELNFCQDTHAKIILHVKM